MKMTFSEFAEIILDKFSDILTNQVTIIKKLNNIESELKELKSNNQSIILRK